MQYYEQVHCYWLISLCTVTMHWKVLSSLFSRWGMEFITLTCTWSELWLVWLQWWDGSLPHVSILKAVVLVGTPKWSAIWNPRQKALINLHFNVPPKSKSCTVANNVNVMWNIYEQIKPLLSNSEDLFPYVHQYLEGNVSH